MTSSRPKRQVCPVCVHDDDLELLQVGDEWIFICSYEGHPPYEWRPTPEQKSVGSYRSGLGNELGVYEDLLACVVDGWAEYGVIEHRFAEASRPAYDFLVARYGHRALRPTAYSASSFLGGALGQLWREQAIGGRFGPATGYWHCNGRVGTYAPAGTPDDQPILSWVSFATETLGVNADDWPSLGYTAG